MYSLNRATILGNVTRDPEVKQTATGQSVCNFGVATNRAWTDPAGVKQEQAEFHQVVAWGKLADICGQYMTKGKKVYVEGRLQTREWQAQDGSKRNRTEIVADNVILLDRAGAPMNPGSPSVPSARPASVTSSVTSDIPAANPSDEIKLEDIPF